LLYHCWTTCDDGLSENVEASSARSAAGMFAEHLVARHERSPGTEIDVMVCAQVDFVGEELVTHDTRWRAVVKARFQASVTQIDVNLR